MPTNLDALLRYHTINHCLQQRSRKWGWEDLANACADYADEVAPRDSRSIPSKRTIQNDIKVMRSGDLGYFAPIGTENGCYFYQEPNFSIKNATLRKVDIQNIALATKVLGQYKGFGFFEDLQAVFSRFESRVELHFNHQVQDKIQFESAIEMVGQSFLKDLLESILSQTPVKVAYQKFTQTDKTTHVFHPYLLKEYNSRWYVLGFSEQRQRLATFALDRIASLERLELHSYLPNTLFNPATYFSNTIGVTYWGQKIERILVKVDLLHLPYVLTKPLHHSQIRLQNSGDGVLFEYQLVLNPELESMLMALIDRVEVLEPLTLRASLRQKLADSFKKHL